MRRLIEIIFALLIFITFSPLIIFISFKITLAADGPIIYWSKRIGKNNNIFLMPKFRTMHANAPQVASHLLKDSSENITRFGIFLRKYSLDELPQIYSIINNDMSFVGPRPALFNQYDLIDLRTNKNIHKIKPGITGWAQINGRNDISWEEKFELDLWYLENQSLWLDIKILSLTLKKVFVRDGISPKGEDIMPRFDVMMIRRRTFDEK